MGKISNQNFSDAIDEAKRFFLKRINIEPTLVENDKITTKNQEKSVINNIIKEKSFSSQLFKKNIHIYSHLDADGLAAAAILSSAFQKEGFGHQISILKQLNTNYIKNIAERAHKSSNFIIFADFGSGQIDIIRHLMEDIDYLILDHHEPADLKSITENHVNPHFYNISGTDAISGAGVCYLFSKALNKSNVKLSVFALIGALGDMQNKTNNGKFIGFNKQFVQEARKEGLVQSERNIAISRVKPLDQAVAYTLPINIPQLSGNIQEARSFLNHINVKAKNELNEPRNLQNLTDLEKKSLTKGLVHQAIVELNLDATVAQKFITTYYIFPHLSEMTELTDGTEIVNILNGCGRMNRPDIGIGMLLGDQKAQKQSLAINESYRKLISTGLEKAKKNMKQEKFIIYFYDQSIPEKIVGTICSILSRSENDLDKPIFGLANSDEKYIKISARASSTLISQGLHLGKIMRTVCKSLKCEDAAGGHPPAAGGRILKSDLDNFLLRINEMVKTQLKN